MQCLLGRSTDDRFAREMYKKCEGHGRFELAPKMRVDHQFCVRHYAGKVVYSTEGIIDKNRDTLQQEGVDMLLSSGSDFTVLMGEIEAKSTKVYPVRDKPGRGGTRLLLCLFGESVNLGVEQVGVTCVL